MEKGDLRELLEEFFPERKPSAEREFEPVLAELLKEDGERPDRRLEAIDWAIEREIGLMRSSLKAHDKAQLLRALHSAALDATEGLDTMNPNDPRFLAQAEASQISLEREQQEDVTPKVEGEFKKQLGRLQRLRRIQRYLKEGSWGDK